MLLLKRLKVSEFRAVASADLSFASPLVAFVGPNGAGKTNFLEAISFLAPGRGLLGAKLGDVARRGGNFGNAWGVWAEIERGANTVRLGTGLVRDTAGRDRRQFRLEGEAASGSEIGEIVRLSWLTPALERLFEESSGVRRTFFDRLVIALEARHQSRLARYERATSERLRLLKDGVLDGEWLASLEALAAAEGAAIAAARVRTLAALNASIAAGASADEPFPRARLSLSGLAEEAVAGGTEPEAEALLRDALARSRPRDGAAGRTLVGPSRTDLEVAYAQTGMPAQLASTGEQKALILNILLAHVRLVAERHGAAPIVLLDEIAAHLDAERRSALLQALTGLGAQVFLTGTESHAFVGTGAEILHVERGIIAAPARTILSNRV